MAELFPRRSPLVPPDNHHQSVRRLHSGTAVSRRLFERDVIPNQIASVVRTGTSVKFPAISMLSQVNRGQYLASVQA